MVNTMTARTAANENGVTAEIVVDGPMREHMPLVEQIASRVLRRLPSSVQRADLVAAGMEGLFHALRSSTHTSPEMFCAYARIRIQGAMLDELRRHDWSPRRKRSQEETSSNAATDAGKGASSPRGGAPVSVVRFDDLPANASAFALPAEGGSPLDELIARRDQAALHTALKALPEREARVVRMRYFEEMPSKAIAAVMSVSEARVSQLSARATTLLRGLLSPELAEEHAEAA